jgi:hypothetical protein
MGCDFVTMRAKTPALNYLSSYTNRPCFTAVTTKLANNGRGAKGRDLSSRWNWTPMNKRQ